MRDARGTFIGSVNWTAPSPGASGARQHQPAVALITTAVTVFVLVVAAFTFVGTAHRLENA
ncbi:MAG: hypothetical protein R3D80_12675 [Paracoccaceae bacterium]